MMGQYYKAVKLNNDHSSQEIEYINPFEGMKITEHSWIGNEFVGSVMNLMLPGNPWYKSKVVWAGDYYGDEDGEINYYSAAKTNGRKFNSAKSLSKQEQKKCFLINHSKNQYVDYSKLKGRDDDWIVNPLPLLTALGNDRGGGDYYENLPDADKVGIWAFDILSVDFIIPEGFKELIVNFE